MPPEDCLRWVADQDPHTPSSRTYQESSHGVANVTVVQYRQIEFTGDDVYAAVCLSQHGERSVAIAEA